MSRNICPSIITLTNTNTCFVTSSFRFGHSLVQSVFRGVNQPWRLGNFYSDSRFAFKDGGHGYVNELEGLAQQPCQKADLRVSEQLTQLLYCNNKVSNSWHGKQRFNSIVIVIKDSKN